MQTTSQSTPLISCRDVTKTYVMGSQKVHALRGVNLIFKRGEMTAIMGPSGSGKSTLMNLIGALDVPTSGNLEINGNNLAKLKSNDLADLRNETIGFVFQQFNLLGRSSALTNVKLPLRYSRKPLANIDARAAECLEMVGLGDRMDHRPMQLSGGQQQRVALIRAMAPRPPVLLLDEPFSSQDTERRVKLAHEVREILKRDGITAILVTHDQYEAFAIADHIGVIHNGSLKQWDNAYDLYHTPADRFVADFIGEGVFVCGNTIENNQIQTELGIIQGELSNQFAAGTQIELLVRPDDIIHDDSSPTKATVIAKDFRGAGHLYTLRMPGSTRLLCLAPSHHNHHVGEEFGVRLNLDHLVIFSREAV